MGRETTGPTWAAACWEKVRPPGGPGERQEAEENSSGPREPSRTAPSPLELRSGSHDAGEAVGGRGWEHWSRGANQGNQQSDVRNPQIPLA